MTTPSLPKQMRDDLYTARRRDPAARSLVEVALTYPGLHAIWAYRVANVLWGRGLRFFARLIQQTTRFLTSVDIHPGATIGQRIFIDHALGVVVGETAEVGDDVLMFHQVTLGGVTMSPGKRHPTIGDRVILGAGAKVLGPVFVGSDAKVGANAVVVRDIPEGGVAVGVPSHSVTRKGEPGTHRHGETGRTRTDSREASMCLPDKQDKKSGKHDHRKPTEFIVPTPSVKLGPDHRTEDGLMYEPAMYI